MPEFITNILEITFLNNTIASYLTALGILLLSLIFLLIVHHIIFKRLKKIAHSTETLLDNFIVEMMDKYIFPILYYGVFYLSTNYLELNEVIVKILNVIGIGLVSIFVIRFIIALIDYWYKNITAKNNAVQSQNFKSFMPAIKAVVWVLGIIFLMANLGFDISAVVTGLGIGGIAVALAAQAVLSDVFSYVSILLDKPFEIGDFIILDSYMGSVEKIGIKTTRIRSLSGEQLIFSNNDLTGSRMRNYKRMEQRRIVFGIGIVYETPPESVKRVPEMLKEIISSHENIRFDRAHFSKYGDFSLNFEIVYYVLSGDYNQFMDIQQSINFEIMDKFKEEGIEFAYPTQTLFVNKVN